MDKIVILIIAKDKKFLLIGVRLFIYELSILEKNIR